MIETNTPLGLMTQRGPTVLWNDSATYSELSTAISWGAVGATCNPVIALAAIRADLPRWTQRIKELALEMPEATESQIGWKVVEEVSLDAARLLLPAFEESHGYNGRLSMQTDPRLARSAKALADQAEYFASLAPNIIVKVPATKTGVEAIEERGDGAFRLHADDLFGGLAVAEQQQGGKAADSIAGGERLLRVAVDFRYPSPPGIAGRNLFQGRREHLAGLAPVRPEIDEYRHVGGGVQHVGLETGG